MELRDLIGRLVDDLVKLGTHILWLFVLGGFLLCGACGMDPHTYAMLFLLVICLAMMFGMGHIKLPESRASLQAPIELRDKEIENAREFFDFMFKRGKWED